MKNYIKLQRDMMGLTSSSDNKEQSTLEVDIEKVKFEEGFECACNFLESMGFSDLENHEYNVADCLRAKRNKLDKNKIRKSTRYKATLSNTKDSSSWDEIFSKWNIETNNVKPIEIKHFLKQNYNPPTFK